MSKEMILVDFRVRLDHFSRWFPSNVCFVHLASNKSTPLFNSSIFIPKKKIKLPLLILAMEPETSELAYPVTAEIPIDLFVSKKHPGLPRGHRAFLDENKNLVFRIDNHSFRSSPANNYMKVLADASGQPLLSILRFQNGLWRCYRGVSSEDKDLVFRVERTKKTFNRVEMEVFLSGERLEDSACDLKVRGSPFQRSCSIYQGDSLLAQTSLMYKLNQIFVSRKKFRLTILPGSFGHDLFAALVVIFLNGKK